MLEDIYRVFMIVVDVVNNAEFLLDLNKKTFGIIYNTYSFKISFFN